MAKSKLAAALAQADGGVSRIVNSTRHEQMTNDELMQSIYDARDEGTSDGGTMVTKANTRNSLLQKAGFDFIDVRKLTPNDKNSYSIDEESIEGLANLIYESKNTTPLVVRETDEGLQIVDGERRYRAHLLLGERYGNRWYMVPARVFRYGTLTDEDTEFILHAENIGQRNMTPTERARGFAAVADRLMKQRQSDPSMAGRTTKQMLAEQFGVSERTATMEMNIGRNLVDEGLALYDKGEITKQGADAMASLPAEEQRDIAQKVQTGKLDKHQVPTVARGQKKTSTRIPKTTDQHLMEARACLKRALKGGGTADRVYIAEMRNLLDKLDPDAQAQHEEEEEEAGEE